MTTFEEIMAEKEETILSDYQSTIEKLKVSNHQKIKYIALLKQYCQEVILYPIKEWFKNDMSDRYYQIMIDAQECREQRLMNAMNNLDYDLEEIEIVFAELEDEIEKALLK